MIDDPHKNLWLTRKKIGASHGHCPFLLSSPPAMFAVPIWTFPHSKEAENDTKLIKNKNEFKFILRSSLYAHGWKEAEDKTNKI